MFGCGGVGLSAVMIGAALGARVVAVDPNPPALAAATGFGAAHALPAGPAVPGRVRELTGGGAHLTVDAIGATEVVQQALDSLRPRGRHVQLGLLPDAVRLDVSALIARELQWLGSHGAGRARLPGAAGAGRVRRVRPAELVTRVIGLDDVPAALAAMDRRQPDRDHGHASGARDLVRLPDRTDPRGSAARRVRRMRVSSARSAVGSRAKKSSAPASRVARIAVAISVPRSVSRTRVARRSCGSGSRRTSPRSCSASTTSVVERGAMRSCSDSSDSRIGPCRTSVPTARNCAGRDVPRGQRLPGHAGAAAGRPPRRPRTGSPPASASSATGIAVAADRVVASC